MNKFEKRFLETGRVDIGPNKWSLLVIGIGVMAFGLISLWTSKFSIADLSSWIIFILGLLILAWGIKDFSSQLPVLTLDGTGIRNHEPNLYDFEMLKWLDIKNVTTKKRKNDEYLIIETRQGMNHELKMDYVSLSAKALKRMIEQKLGLTQK